MPTAQFMLHVYSSPLLRALFKFLKWWMHLFTRECELQRLCEKESQENLTQDTVARVELSLLYSSKLPDLALPIKEKQSFDVNSAVRYIKLQKHIQEPNESLFTENLQRCLSMVSEMGKMHESVVALQNTPYDSEDEAHEAKLMQLWDTMMPETKLSARISKEWQELGFQGRDPATDFRGMGLLGLEHLLYFAQNYPLVSQSVFNLSRHPERGFSYAIVGINLTKMAVDLLRESKIRDLLYHVSNQPECSRDEMTNFNDVYCYLFMEFGKLWREKQPENMLAFNSIRDLLKKQTEDRLLGQMENVSAAIVSMRSSAAIVN